MSRGLAFALYSFITSLLSYGMGIYMGVRRKRIHTLSSDGKRIDIYYVGGTSEHFNYKEGWVKK